MGVSLDDIHRYSRMDNMVYSGDNLFFLLTPILYPIKVLVD